MLMDYQAFAVGLDSRNLIPINENILNLVKKNPKQDYYSSLYIYNDKHLAAFKLTKSLKGITDVKTRRLFFDFDDGLSPGKAQADTIEVYNRLLEQGIPAKNIDLYFSGQKGFHLEVPTTDSLTRQEFVNIVFNLAADLQTFDVKINDEARILRVPFSRHPKSGLYKIPITIEELQGLTIEAIKEFAKDTESYDIDAFKYAEPITLPGPINVLKIQTYKKVGPVLLEDIKGFDTNDLDLSQCPKWMAKERYALSHGYFYGSDTVGQGERNISFMILAATYKNQGFSREQTLALLETTADKQALRTKEEPYSTEKLNREVLNSVYSIGWQGGIYGPDERILQITRERFNIEDPVIQVASVGIDDVGLGFKDFAKNIDKNRIYTGLESLDKQLVLTSGMLVSLLAAPGAGKTTLANLFVESLNKAGENTLYFSLDLYKNLLFNRLLQKYSKYPFEKILEMYKEDEPDEVLMNAYSEVLKNYSKVAFNFKSGTTIDELEYEVKNYTQSIGKPPKLVVVDYLEKIRTQYADATASTSYAAGRLSDIAKKYDTTVLLLVQPSKIGGGDPRDEFKNYRAIKGSSSIESESRCVLGLYRCGYNPADSSRDNFATISILKNNTGSLGRLDYSWDGLAGTFTELNREQRQELKQLRSELANKSDEYDI